MYIRMVILGPWLISLSLIGIALARSYTIHKFGDQEMNLFVIAFLLFFVFASIAVFTIPFLIPPTLRYGGLEDIITLDLTGKDSKRHRG